MGGTCAVCGRRWDGSVVLSGNGRERGGGAKQLQFQHGKAHVAANWTAGRRVASVQSHAVGTPEERVNNVGGPG